MEPYVHWSPSSGLPEIHVTMPTDIFFPPQNKYTEKFLTRPVAQGSIPKGASPIKADSPELYLKMAEKMYKSGMPHVSNRLRQARLIPACCPAPHYRSLVL